MTLLLVVHNSRIMSFHVSLYTIYVFNPFSLVLFKKEAECPRVVLLALVAEFFQREPRNYRIIAKPSFLRRLHTSEILIISRQLNFLEDRSD